VGQQNGTVARFRRIAAVTMGLLLLLLGAAALTLRAMRGRHRAPEPVAGASDVYRVRNLYVDLYGARAGKAVVLFDAGLDASGAPIDSLLIQMNAKRADVRGVFLTHGHPDHVAGAPLYPGVLAGADDAALMRRQRGKGLRFARAMAAVIGIPAVDATDLLVDRREIKIGDQLIIALPFPGHTAGSFLYLFRGVLFVGDAFNFEKGALVLPPRKFTEDPDLARRSIAYLPAQLTGLTVKTICTGHGGCTPPEKTKALLADLVHRAESAP
jgi:glyoxylase-like metal-dependent hydrolase (beta-lactamase superfamily II)